jgi:anti-anti-sigma factor
MELKETKEGEVTIVTIAGRLDSTNYIGVEKRLTTIIDNDERNLLLDCSDLEFLSSAGLRTFLGILKKMAAAGGTFSLCALSDKIKRIFELSGFHKLFTMYGTRSEALKDLAEV